MDETLTPVQKFLVSETEKIHAIPQFLQPYFIEIEARTQDFLKRFSTDYTGGNWNYYQLSSGGLFMAPSSRKFYRVEVPQNYFSEEVDAEAAGLIAFLYAVNLKLASQHDSPNGPDRNLNTLYYDVLRYAVSQTPYKTKIACAID